MNLGSGSGCWKSGDVLPEQFPVGLRVLVVDDDPTCLAIMKKMLWKCRYEVTTCKSAEVALSLLREKKNGFDIVITDVHMPDRDGFKLLEYIGLKMDLPVIMMSADDSKDVVMEGVTHGAYDYLIKPVRIESLRNIWQHIVRKRRREWKQAASLEEGDRQQKPSQDVDQVSSANEGSWKNSKKRKEEEEEAEERDDTSSPKKARVVWSMELHQRFIRAVRHLGMDKAVPKKILELMNVPGLTRENIASHLQKYRLYLRKVGGVSQHENGLNSSFLRRPNASIMSSLNGLNLQAIATANQIRTQSFATLQAAAPGGSGHNSVLKESSMLAMLVNLSKGFQSNNFSLGSNSSGMSTLTNRGMVQEEANCDIKGPRGFPSNYDIVNELHQPISQNWSLQNVGSTLDTSHHPSIQGTQGVSSSGHANLMGGSQLSSVGGNTGERFPGSDHQSTNFRGQFGQGDLMSVYLQQQGNVGPVETEFGFDGYAWGNPSV